MAAPTGGEQTGDTLSLDNSKDDETPVEQQRFVVETGPPGGKNAGRFQKFNALVGKGQYKKVYRAFDMEEGRDVAWNEVEYYNKETKELVMNEVKLLHKMEHPYIIKLYEAWQDRAQGKIVFVTELMTSGSLREYAKGKTLRLKIIKKWCRQILDALVYLHSRGVIHRDIKSENCFINGPTGDLKVGDLGLAKFMGAEKASTCLGTSNFVAPEVLQGNYTVKADIYAFGVTVLELVTQETPFAAECISDAKVLLKKSLPNFEDQLPECLTRVADEDVRQFVLLCLAPEETRLSAAELMSHPFLAKEEDDGTGARKHKHRHGASDVSASSVDAVVDHAAHPTPAPAHPVEGSPSSPERTAPSTPLAPPAPHDAMFPPRPPVATNGLLDASVHSPVRQAPGPAPAVEPVRVDARLGGDSAGSAAGNGNSHAGLGATAPIPGLMSPRSSSAPVMGAPFRRTGSAANVSVPGLVARVGQVFGSETDDGSPDNELSSSLPGPEHRMNLEKRAEEIVHELEELRSSRMTLEASDDASPEHRYTLKKWDAKQHLLEGELASLKADLEYLTVKAADARRSPSASPRSSPPRTASTSPALHDGAPHASLPPAVTHALGAHPVEHSGPSGDHAVPGAAHGPRSGDGYMDAAVSGPHDRTSGAQPTTPLFGALTPPVDALRFPARTQPPGGLNSSMPVFPSTVPEPTAPRSASHGDGTLSSSLDGARAKMVLNIDELIKKNAASLDLSQPTGALSGASRH